MLFIIFKNVKKMMKSLSLLKQENYDQKKLNVRLMLNFNLNYVYINTNLNNIKHLKRVLILFCQTRFDAEIFHFKISSYIRYNVLSLNVVKIINK